MHTVFKKRLENKHLHAALYLYLNVGTSKCRVKKKSANLSTTSMSKQNRLSIESVFRRIQDFNLNISGELVTRPF